MIPLISVGYGPIWYFPLVIFVGEYWLGTVFSAGFDVLMYTMPAAVFAETLNHVTSFSVTSLVGTDHLQA